jgi:hypothetical protein
LYYWPKLSAIVGVATNFFFLSVLAVFSWLAFLGKTTQALQSNTSTEGQSDKLSTPPSKTLRDSSKREMVHFYDASDESFQLVDSPENISAGILTSSEDDEDLFRTEDDSDSVIRKRTVKKLC